MAKKGLYGKNIITALDIKRRHPMHLNCETDRQYARLANDIFDMLYPELDFMDDVQIKNVCVSLALYFEDIHSGTHLFETFTRLYQRMFGLYLPFYASETPSGRSSESHRTGTNGRVVTDEGKANERDAMRFMLWHSCVAERDGAVLNPTNDGIAGMADRILDLWQQRKQSIAPNEELSDYIYSEDTQRDADEVKLVLIWLSRYCHLGRWHTNPRPQDDGKHLKELFRGANRDTIEWGNECFSLFDERVWPLSLTPQHIYAEMIRLDMGDPDDELALAIEQMKEMPLGMYQVKENGSEDILFENYKGERFRVSHQDFFGNTRQLARQNTHIIGSFLCLDGRWRINGPSLWLSPKQRDYKAYVEEQTQKHSWMHDYRGQYDDYINSHGGRRLYFFPGADEYQQWLKNDLELENAGMVMPIEDKDLPIASFFEDNGQMTICLETKAICHPDNPYYDKAFAEDHGLEFVGYRGICSPGMLMHLVEHHLLPDAMFNDIRGREHGRQLMQKNMEFLMRCLRRDIESDEVISDRYSISLKV